MWRDDLRRFFEDSDRTIRGISREVGMDRKVVRRVINGEPVTVRTLEKVLDELDLKLMVVDKGWEEDE